MEMTCNMLMLCNCFYTYLEDDFFPSGLRVLADWKDEQLLIKINRKSAFTT